MTRPNRGIPLSLTPKGGSMRDPDNDFVLEKLRTMIVVVILVKDLEILKL